MENLNSIRCTIFFVILFSFKLAAATELPSEAIRLKIFDKFIQELGRLDGEGLIVRSNRPENWPITVGKLRDQVKAAKNPIEFGQVFRKLDATYTNLHAYVTLDEEFDIAKNRIRPKISVKFGPKVVYEKQKNISYSISAIDTQMVKDFSESTRPAIGDELLAINSISMDKWSRENFIFCKFPLRSQCEINIFDHFRKGLLSWDWRSSLVYTLKRNARVWNINVPFEIPSKGALNSNGKEVECGLNENRYTNFKLQYKGANICVFESDKFPNISVLRISTFRYQSNPKESVIQTLQAEVDQFYALYWQAKAPQTKKLIIDLIDNGGGDVPVPWYQIFYNHPFQEQYVQFKKIKELEGKEIRKELFYENSGKEIWFSDLLSKGAFLKIKEGNFLPPIPQFCASEDKNCALNTLHQPKPHGFNGEVRILANEWCISTCSGFIWSIKKELKKRVKVIGIPDSGDSSYARLYIDIYLDHKSVDGFRVVVSPRIGGERQGLPNGSLLRQQVSATRSTDEFGRIISGKPTPVDLWIPYEYRNFDETWEEKVFKAALTN